jgi:hypothetical protein
MTQREYKPLHYAAENGHIEIVSLLLEKGANIEAKEEVIPIKVAVGIPGPILPAAI